MAKGGHTSWVIDDQKFQRLARSGYTRLQLSVEFGVSRQAIAQKERKLGLKNTLDANRPAKRERPITKHEIKYGLPLERVRELRAMGAMAAYTRQRQNAQTRGIEWLLTFKDWWTVWEQSGMWSLRGRAMGGWVMGRKGDIGPYALGNVYICNHSENASVRSERQFPGTTSSQRNRRRRLTRMKISSSTVPE